MAIRAMRKEQGILQEGPADATNIERVHIGRIERGEVNVSFRNLMKVAEALDIELSAILRLAGYQVRL